MSHTTPAQTQVHRTLCIWQMTTMWNTPWYKQHAVTYPLTLFIAHSLLSLSLVADCNIRNIHFNTTSNTVTTLHLHNVRMSFSTCPFSKMHINFHGDVPATRKHCNFIISFTWWLILVKNTTTSFEVSTVLHSRILVYSEMLHGSQHFEGS